MFQFFSKHGYFKGHEIFSAEAEDAIKGIERNKSTHAFLDNCWLTEAHFKRLLTALEKTDKLKYINIFGCNFTEKQLKQLIGSLKKNQSIEEVIIGNNIPTNLYEEIMDTVSKRTLASTSPSMTQKNK